MKLFFIFLFFWLLVQLAAFSSVFAPACLCLQRVSVLSDSRFVFSFSRNVLSSLCLHKIRFREEYANMIT